MMPACAIPLSCASLLTEVQLPAMPTAAQPVQFRIPLDEHELLFDRNRMVGRGGSSTAYQCRLYDRQWEEEKQPIMRKIQLGFTVARKNMMKLLNPASPLAVDYHRIPLRLVNRGTDFDDIHSLTELVIKHADDPKALQHENRVVCHLNCSHRCNGNSIINGLTSVAQVWVLRGNHSGQYEREKPPSLRLRRSRDPPINPYSRVDELGGVSPHDPSYRPLRHRVGASPRTFSFN
ncbi:MAG: uncharacterized protein KVP18_004758 [Porospora cf. gigantea A]|uniref:uncharacterized protein n=1 Tax=Porospora cf. gigantea A TaxID=2853593 RepID=UPI00355A223A|nr:MAG: hypothetical protein KVP18_004758 [Porospora cf. gigantea A]